MADATEESRSTKDLVKYIPLISTCDPSLIRFSLASGPMTSYERYFDRFAKEFGLAELPWLIKTAMKDKHTIIEKWPYRLKLTPAQSGALGGGLSSKERYMEWTSVPRVDRAS